MDDQEGLDWARRAYVVIESALAVLPLLELQEWNEECKRAGVEFTNILTTAPARIRGASVNPKFHKMMETVS